MVLSLTGEPVGELAGYRGDRIAIRVDRDEVIWVSRESIYIEHPLYVELICHREHLDRYRVEEP